MELAKNLEQWRSLSQAEWLARANRILPPVVAVVLVVLIAARGADLTWTLLAAPTDQDTVPAAVVAGRPAATGTTVGFDALSEWKPFGEPPALDPDQPAGIPFPDDAPETSLALTLKGLIEVQELPEAGETFVPEDGSAIISSGRPPDRIYHTGDTIEGASGAKLFAVFSDHVMLDRGGRYETLRFPPIEDTVRQGVSLNSRIDAAPLRPGPQPTVVSPTEMRESLNQVAMTLSEHLSLAPHREGGRNVGFRLQPSGNGQVFQQLGLEPGDVLTEVNGIPLDNVSNMPRVLQALTESPRADVMIRRNGFDEAMSLDIGQIQRLAESLQ